MLHKMKTILFVLFFLSGYSFSEDSIPSDGSLETTDTIYVSNSDKLVSEWLLHQRVKPMMYKIGNIVDTQFVIVNYNNNNIEMIEYQRRNEKIDNVMNVIGSATMILGFGFFALSPTESYSSNNKQRGIYIVSGMTLISLGLVEIIAF